MGHQLMPPTSFLALTGPSSAPPPQLIPPTLYPALTGPSSAPPPQLIPPTSYPALTGPSTPPPQHQLMPPTTFPALTGPSPPPPQPQLIPPTTFPALTGPPSAPQYAIQQRVLAPQPMDVDIKYICTLCETNFEKMSSLKRHHKSIHEAYSQTEKGVKRKSKFKPTPPLKRNKKTENTYGGLSIK